MRQRPNLSQTLLARSMGRGRTLIDAIQEIEALPPKDKLRTLLWPRIETLRVALEDDPSPEAQEIVMNAEKIYNQRLAQQRKEGRKEGVEQTLRDAITTVCAARGLKPTTAQRATLEAQHAPATLRRWLARAITAADASEIFGAG
jgi:flagellar biosynthesis/type III secretory pathway protein FliH